MLGDLLTCFSLFLLCYSGLQTVNVWSGFMIIILGVFVFVFFIFFNAGCTYVLENKNTQL